MPEAPLSPLAWGVLLLAPLAVLLAVVSALLERSGPIRLRHWVKGAGGALRKLYDDPPRFAAFRVLLSLAARLAPLAFLLFLGRLLAGLGVPRPTLWAAAGTALVVVVSEATNRMFAGPDPEGALSRLTRVYRVLRVLLAPPIVLLAPLLPGVRERREGEDEEEEEATDEEIEAYIDVGTREGILEPEEGDMVWSIVGFGDTQVRSVMTPRVDMVVAPADATLDALADRFIDSGHSRLPIFEESIDRIVGILHIRDVLRALRTPEPPTVAELLKPPFFIPETKPLGELLKELQARFQQMAIVVDEYGGTAGMVTIEDLLEEIVGEIVDEHEAVVAELVPLGDGAYRLDGRAHLELLEDLFAVDFDEQTVETVGGLIYSELGRVPEPGDAVECLGLRFTVEEVAARRIQSVRVERIAAGEEGEERA
ncbi:MAG TPA: hemolysin family protein [Thermoanaerobaculia bacterium]|nr:hemolysin family protein [Thermoanaerobaculia bacterium]